MKSKLKLRVDDIHLIFDEIPFSHCGLYVGDNNGMKQTFKVTEVTCSKCRDHANLDHNKPKKKSDLKRNRCRGSFMGKDSIISPGCLHRKILR